MLRPVFAAQEGPSLSPGVFSELRFDRNLLRPSAGGSPIAVHRDHAWDVEGKRYLRLDCEGLALIYFTSKDGELGPVFGPFDHLSSVDGVMFTDRRRFAALDEKSGIWSIDGTELRCTVLVARAPA